MPTTPLVGEGGKCLDRGADDNTNGSKVDIYTRNGTSGQSWSHLADATLRAAGKCLDAKAAGTTDGTRKQLTAALPQLPDPIPLIYGSATGWALDMRQTQTITADVTPALLAVVTHISSRRARTPRPQAESSFPIGYPPRVRNEYSAYEGN